MMGDVEKFPQKQTDDMTSLMGLLECGDCHDQWIGLYETGVRVDELHCPYCETHNVKSIQGEREVIFYDYRKDGE